MQIVKFRFFNYEKALAAGDKRTVARELIRLRSWPRVHMELELPDRQLSFSATNEDAVKGCRLKRILYSNNWWDTIEKRVADYALDLIWEKIHEINGKKYDMVGLMSHATKWNIIMPTRDRYWCNKAGLYVTRGILFPYSIGIDITPEATYQLLKKLFAYTPERNLS